MVFDGIIYGKTVRMRSVDVQDAQATFDMRMDPAINKFLGKIEGSVEKQRDYIKAQREKVGDYLFIAEDMKGKPIGMRGIYNLSEDGETCETGRLIGVGNAVQNTEIALLGYDFAFQVLGVNKVYLDVVADNVSVLNSQKRYGAVEIERKYLQDFECDLITSELTVERYEERRPAIYELIERLSK